MWPWKNNKAQHEEAEEALAEAKQKLQEIKSRDPEVKKVATASRKMREENHFAQTLREALGGH